MITGASSGIGKEFAIQLSKTAKKLILMARRKEMLEELAKKLNEMNPKLEVVVSVVDVTDQAQLAKELDDLLENHQIDVLVNNAGLGDVVIFDKSDWDKAYRMIQVNVVATTYITHRLLPPMVSRRAGAIIFIGSGVGQFAVHAAAVYNSTKHFIHGFAKSLEYDLAGMGIRILEVAPGPVNTEFTDHTDGVTPGEPTKWIEITSQQCVEQSIKAYNSGKRLYSPGAKYRFVSGLIGALPTFMAEKSWKDKAKAMRRRQETEETKEGEPDKEEAESAKEEVESTKEEVESIKEERKTKKGKKAAKKPTKKGKKATKKGKEEDTPEQAKEESPKKDKEEVSEQNNEESPDNSESE